MRIPFSFIKSGAAAINPATLALSGWWKPDFAASPWTSTASAGASNGRTLSEGVNPPSAGTGPNGNPADFDGTNDLLATTVLESDLFSAAAGSAIILYNADTAAAAGGAATADAGLLQGAGGYIGLGVNSTGPSIRLFAAAGVDIQLTKAVGSWTAVQMKWNGTTLYARKDSDVWSSIACGNMGDLTSVLWAGKGTSGVFFDGRILEIMTSASTLPDSDFDGVVSYLNATYSLSL